MMIDRTFQPLHKEKNVITIKEKYENLSIIIQSLDIISFDEALITKVFVFQRVVLVLAT